MYSDGVNKTFVVEHRGGAMQFDGFASRRSMVEAMLYNAGFQESGFDGADQIAWLESLRAKIDAAIAQHRADLADTSSETPMPDDTKKSPFAMVDQFNRRWTVGTKALYYSHPSAEPRGVETTSAAWVLGGHSAVVLVDSVSGAVAIDALRMVPDVG
jgi:hypothetical protein